MYNKDLIEVCTKFKLGKLITDPIRAHGGLLHIMWHVETDNGIYAIKQLSTGINLADENIVANYNLTENIAMRFIQHGIPGISAIENSGTYLTVTNKTGFLVYPWVNATAIEQGSISAEHAIKIAVLLAKMHKINLQVPEITEAGFSTHSVDEIVALIKKSASYNLSFAVDLQSNMDNILMANTLYQKSIPFLKQDVVVSHSDLDPKNVLWGESANPIIIDWESARKLNPSYDIINVSLDWSGITTKHFNQELFIKMLNAYKKEGGIINNGQLEHVFYGTFGWIDWLVYNIERACKNENKEQKNLSIEQVTQTLETILRLQDLIPKLIKLA